MSRDRLDRPKPKLLPNVVEVLRLLTEHDKPPWEYDKYREKTKISPRHSLLEVYEATSACMASHRFAEAGVLLNALGQHKNITDLFFFKAALTVLENDPSNTPSSVLEFMKLARNLRSVPKSEVILESIVFALRKNETCEQFNIKLMMEDKNNPTSKVVQNFILDPLVGAYWGIFDYIRWHRNKDLASAERVIKCLLEAIEVPGQWDIFVLKLVEIFVFYDRIDEAEQALVKYVELNPEHINSYIYLCSFLSIQPNKNTDLLFSNLKVLAEKCPSDPRVLEFVEMLRVTFPKRSFKLLLMFLDYPVNSENSRAWRLLYSVAIHMLESNEISEIEAIYSQWNMRKFFWPSIHFNNRCVNLVDKGNSKIHYHKASVLCIFESCHSYTHVVLQLLENTSSKLHAKLLKRIDHIHKLRIAVNNRISEMSMEVDIEL